MNRIAITSAVLTLLIAQVVCCDPGGGGEYVPPDNNEPGGGGASPGGDSIGTVTRVLSSVWAGPGGSLSAVEDPPPNLYNNYSVQLTDGGKAVLKFHSDIVFTLYNNTETGGIYGEIDPSVSNTVRMRLIRGGAQGLVARSGSTTKLEVAFGTSIRVVGTTFFVVYDERTGYVTVGNYDGELYFDPHGAGEILLSPETQVDIPPEGALDFYSLVNDPTLFDELATASASPVEGLRQLREEFDQPPPGEGAASEPTSPPSSVFRSLLKDEGSFYSTDMAESYSIETSATYIEFVLRPELYLADGTPFTTTVLRSILEERWEYAAAGLVSFEIVDDRTIWFFPADSADVTFILDEMSAFPFEMLP